ncbi:site-2 protease family protein [Coprothermobacteraceae bacterium]|nr:site-2 protease family protein [Coprothermobacteraceae bacterium]
MGILGTALFFLLFVLSVVLHELAHGYAAYYSGDRTPKYQGRLTLNPLHHVDPVGTILLPLLMRIAGSPVVFGWAKPVPINPYNLSSMGFFFVSIAGVATNFVLTIVFALLYRLYPATVFVYVALANFVLMAFNLIPLPPLDGSKVLLSFFPFETRMRVMSYDQYGFILLFVLMGFGFFTGYFNLAYNLFIRVFSAVLAI